MPIITFEGPEMNKEQKSMLAKKLTEAAAEVFPMMPKQAFTVVIKENNMDNVASGGILLSVRPKE